MNLTRLNNTPLTKNTTKQLITMESGDKKKTPRGPNHADDEGGIKEKKGAGREGATT